MHCLSSLIFSFLVGKVHLWRRDGCGITLNLIEMMKLWIVVPSSVLYFLEH